MKDQFATFDCAMGLKPRREPLNVGNLIGWSCHGNYPLWENGPEWLVPKMSPFSLTEGRLLEGEKGLVYWCMPAILHSLFLLFRFSLCFCHFNSFPSHSYSFFLALVFYGEGGAVILSLWLLPLPWFTVHGKDPLYTACRDSYFTILAFNHFCLI